uniref:Uncharacterized protein n=1 Tax=Metallosphaera hakonensis JCM 8857 = DSM 7519 TaxID=1293036 RepID=A0A2U9IWV8_9CREN
MQVRLRMYSLVGMVLLTTSVLLMVIAVSFLALPNETRGINRGVKITRSDLRLLQGILRRNLGDYGAFTFRVDFPPETEFSFQV